MIVPGSAHVSCAGDGVLAVANFLSGSNLPAAWAQQQKFVAVEHRDQHTRRVRYPEPR
ncbi:hypothetical protein BH20VER3_BH20VER3_20390 [soil metagenome]